MREIRLQLSEKYSKSREKELQGMNATLS
jgi:hypothetical protein